MSRILVSGANGFLGTVICEKLLLAGYEVTGLDNFLRQASDFTIYLNTFEKFHFWEEDIRNKLDLSPYDVIIHAAAYVGEPICKKFPFEAVSVNLNGTINLLKQKRKDTKFIFHSTGSVYGKLDEICTEKSPANPLSVYGQTKLDAENYILNNHKDESIIYRFSTAYGVSGNMRVNLLINDFTKRAVNEKSITVFEADFKRSFLHCIDVARSIMSAIANFDKMKGEIYNVGDPNGNWSKRQVAEYLRTLTGCLVTYADKGYKDPDARNYEISFEKIKPFFITQISMKEGIDQLLKGIKSLKEYSRFS